MSAIRISHNITGLDPAGEEYEALALEAEAIAYAIRDRCGFATMAPPGLADPAILQYWGYLPDQQIPACAAPAGWTVEVVEEGPAVDWLRKVAADLRTQGRIP